MTNAESSPSARQSMLLINGQVTQDSLPDKEMGKVITAILEVKKNPKEK